MQQKNKGFTLVEVLIVVIIIAILASLILPRMTAQSEQAIIAEAEQMLGVLRRAQQQNMDIDGTTTYVAFAGYDDAQAYSMLGINPPPSNAKFRYWCQAGGVWSYCMALRKSEIAPPASLISLYDNGSYQCSGNYTLANAADNTKGCTRK